MVRHRAGGHAGVARHDREDALTLNALFFFAGLNQSVKTASNVTVLLTALALQGSPVLVGALIAVSGVMPMLFAVPVGRLNDRFGARPFLLGGAAIVVAAMALPAAWPGLPALFITTALAGLGSTAFSVSVQSSIGTLSSPDDRTRNFSWFSIAMSAGGVVGPIVAGPIIDLAGYRVTFAALAVMPLVPLAVLAAGRLTLPPPKGAGAREARGIRGTIELLRVPRLRTIYIITALHVGAWEVFSFLVPVYGNEIGLAATSIGLILSAFAAATFFVRIVMPFFVRRFAPLAAIRWSLVLAGVLFIFFPLTSSVPLLAVLAFVLGLGLGVTQPLAMSVLHEAAPAGRTGEAVGMRSAMVGLSATTTPIIYGAIGAAVGLAPVFWGVAVAVWISVWVLR